MNFLLSLREDELAKLDRFQGRVPGCSTTTCASTTSTSRRRGARSTGPKDEYNRRLPPGAAPATIDEELVDEVLDEVRTRDGVRRRRRAGRRRSAPATRRRDRPRRDAAAAARHAAAVGRARPPAAARRTLRLATLREQLGGTENIVRRHLEDALDALSDADRDLAVDVLRPLVSPTGTKIAWRAADLAYWAKRPARAGRADPARAVERRAADPAHGHAAGRRRPTSRRATRSSTTSSPRRSSSGAPSARTSASARELARELEAQASAREQAEREARRRRRRRIVRGGRARARRAVARRGARGAATAASSPTRARSPRARRRSCPSIPSAACCWRRAAVAAPRHGGGRAGAAAVARRVARARARSATGARGRAPAARRSRPPPARRPAPCVAPLAIAPDGRTVAAVRRRAPAAVAAAQRARRSRPRVRIGRARRASPSRPTRARLLVVGDDGDRAHGARRHATPSRSRGDVRAAAADRRPTAATSSRSGRAGAAVWDARTGRRVARLDERRVRSARRSRPPAADRAAGRRSASCVAWRWRSGRTATARARAGRAERQRAGTRRRPASPSTAPRRGQGARRRGERRATRAAAGQPRRSARRRVHQPRRLADRHRPRRRASSCGARTRPWTAPAQRVARARPRRRRHRRRLQRRLASSSRTASTDGIARVWESVDRRARRRARGSHGGRRVARVQLERPLPGDGRRGPHGARCGTSAASGRCALDHGASTPSRQRGGARVAVVESGGALRLWDARRRATRGRRGPRAPGAAARRRRARADLHPTSVALAGDDRVGARGLRVAGRRRAGRARAAWTSPRAASASQFDRGGPVQQVASTAPGASPRSSHEHGRRHARASCGTCARAAAARRRGACRSATPSGLTDVAFSPDGRRLLVTTVFGAARIFDSRDARRRCARSRAAAPREPGPEAFYRGVVQPGRQDRRGGRLARRAAVGRRAPGPSAASACRATRACCSSVAYDADRAAHRHRERRRHGTRVGRARRDACSPSSTVTPAASTAPPSCPTAGSSPAGDDRTVRVYPCPTCARGRDALLDQARRQVTRGLSERERAEFAG